MATWIRSVTNALSESIDIIVPGIDPDNLITIAPSATVDLMNVCTYDELGALQSLLSDMVGRGSLTTAATVDPSTIGLDDQALSANVVHTTGNETVAGIKTFSSAPVLSSLTASTVPYLGSGKALTSSAVTPTELGYVSGATSALQTQINTKKATATGNTYKFETTDVSGNLQETTVTPARAVATDSNGLPVASTTTDTELSYVAGVTSSIQTQLNNGLQVFKVTGIDGTTTGATTVGTTANNSRRFYPMFVSVEVTTASAITVAGAASFGTNSTAYDNILGISTLTGLTAVNELLMFTPAVTAAIVSVAPGTAMKIDITTGFTATTATLEATIVGYYA